MAVVARKRQHGTTYYVTTEWRGKKYWERVGKDRREAARLNTRRRKEREEGSFVPRALATSTTVGAFGERWLEGRTCRWAEDEARYMRRHVLSRAWFADMRIEDVRPRHIGQLAAELKLTVSERTKRVLAPKTVTTLVGIVTTMFRDAVIAELVASNPCVLPPDTLQRRSVKRRRPYELADIAKLLGCRDVHPTARMFAALVLLTGMREGEACGRRWRDLDTEAKPLWCLTVGTQYDDQPLKSDEHQAGEHARKVPVHPALAAVLTWWRAVGFALVHRRAPTATDFIVPSSTGECYGRSTAYSMWRRALDKAGVENLSLHSTRHTFITLARRGGAIRDVLEKVTHNAKGAVIDEYTHWDWAPLCAAVACLTIAPVGVEVGDAEQNGSRMLVAPPGVEPRDALVNIENGADIVGNGGEADPRETPRKTLLLGPGSAARQHQIEEESGALGRHGHGPAEAGDGACDSGVTTATGRPPERVTLVWSGGWLSVAGRERVGAGFPTVDYVRIDEHVPRPDVALPDRPDVATMLRALAAIHGPIGKLGELAVA